MQGVGGYLDTDSLTRALYSSDASLYRITPAGVCRPRDASELEDVLAASFARRVPVTMRGAGTSCAGNAIGPGAVVDVGRHLDTIHAIDPKARTASVDPGVVHSRLQAAAAPYGLRFGPDPSTSNRCTIGGMIGNNACGPRALGFGRTADNVITLSVITGTGEKLDLDSRDDLRDRPSPTLRRLRGLVEENLGVIRTEFAGFSRQLSGYSLEHLLPENRFNVARFLAGTEGTLAVTTRAVLRLVPDPAHTVMIALGYRGMPEAADDLRHLLGFRPVACEGFDSRIVEVAANRQGADPVPQLPAGEGWLFLELAGESSDELLARAEALVAAAGGVDARIVTDPAEAARLWRIRADGAGLAALALDAPAHAGWEDAAVPPSELGGYLRDFDQLLAAHGLHALPYGHFGEGCVHARIDFPFDSPDGAGAYRRFVTDAARLVGRYHGSLSGEHGDGRARSELLPHMYSPAALRLFAAVKHLFDPDNLLNPGVLVDPEPLDSHLRLVEVRDAALTLHHPDFSADAHKCNGVGRCVAPVGAAPDVMCPSYRATREEKDSTRGRARVLQEMLNGSTITGGFRSPEVMAALDLCLACKGCFSECPSGVDLADLKSRTLHQAFAGRLRPRSHYSLGSLPRWGRLVTAVPLLARLANLAMTLPGSKHLLSWMAGVDQRRPLPALARRPARKGLATPPRATGTPVALWVDSFSDCFEGTHLPALITVLERAGYAPEVISEPACCGLTWITTGQRDEAARRLASALDVLAPYAERGIPVVGVEPSCLAVWRGDAASLVDDPRLASVAANLHTLAELLRRSPGFVAPDLRGHRIVVQPHCHHASVLGWEADAELLARTGAEVVTLGGCCGLAGNFGVEAGHYDVSVAIAEDQLLPALRAAGPEAIVLADGFSCRKQISDLAARDARTLAELLCSHRPAAR